MEGGKAPFNRVNFKSGVLRGCWEDIMALTINWLSAFLVLFSSAGIWGCLCLCLFEPDTEPGSQLDLSGAEISTRRPCGDPVTHNPTDRPVTLID